MFVSTVWFQFLFVCLSFFSSSPVCPCWDPCPCCLFVWPMPFVSQTAWYLATCDVDTRRYRIQLREEGFKQNVQNQILNFYCWPQKIKLKLRVGQTSKIRFKVANAKKYPVDLYYLMDLSNSMSDDRDTIVSKLDFLFIPHTRPSYYIIDFGIPSQHNHFFFTGQG